MRRNDAVQVEGRRQERMHDGVLIVRLVLGVRVEDEAGELLVGQRVFSPDVSAVSDYFTAPAMPWTK